MSVREIARIAKISHAAVSLALRGSPKVSPATRRRVERIAKQMGYRTDAKVREFMTHLSLNKAGKSNASFGVISLYDSPHPWEQSLHLNRIHAGMKSRAEELGYRLDPVWLKAPGMTYRRACSILEARGVQGLLCFGSPDFESEFPEELSRFAVVTQGLSIKSSLHRVISDGYTDTWNALERVHALGYQRPGLALGSYEEVRTRHANASAYLGWCEHKLGKSPAVPILRFDRVDEAQLGAWLDEHRPDVMLFQEHYSGLAAFSSALQRLRIRVPDQLAVVVISQVVRNTGFCGLEENQAVIGAWAVELLVGRIVNRDFGIPARGRVEMVESQWVEGASLPGRVAARIEPRRT